MKTREVGNGPRFKKRTILNVRRATVKTVIKFRAKKILEGIPIKLEKRSLVRKNRKPFFLKNFALTEKSQCRKTQNENLQICKKLP